jgi:hypothetical protein
MGRKAMVDGIGRVLSRPVTSVRRIAGKARRRLGRLLLRESELLALRTSFGATSGQDALDHYVTVTPSAQTSIDIFKGEWSSRFPASSAVESGGQAVLFEDDRVAWAIERLGGVAGFRVLELGPLEGGHTYMLEKAGASRIFGVEANARAYLKCLLTKEVLELERCQFVCGDFIEYLRGSSETFELCFASGVLYHQLNPAELIQLAAKVAPRLYLWTHYYDADIVRSNREWDWRFPSSKAAQFQGFNHTLYRHEYGPALGWQGFCGGTNPYSHWLSREDLLRCLEHFGWKVRATAFDQPDYPNGPALALIAERSS